MSEPTPEQIEVDPELEALARTVKEALRREWKWPLRDAAIAAPDLDHLEDSAYAVARTLRAAGVSPPTGPNAGLMSAAITPEEAEARGLVRIVRTDEAPTPAPADTRVALASKPPGTAS